MPFYASWLSQILSPIVKPAARFLVGLLAIPLLRFMRMKLQPNRAWDAELEKDLEQWFRASLVLFLATKNVEEQLAHWISEKQIDFDLNSNWFFAAGRLLLAIGVIESMPDQHLFPIIHPGPRPLRWIPNVGLIENIHRQIWPLLRGILCMHLSRSSPVFAILAVIFSGQQGWVFYFLAIFQYLIIGLVTSRDKAMDVLSQFDQEVARRRQALINEIEEESGEKKPTVTRPVVVSDEPPSLPESPPVPSEQQSAGPTP